MQVVAKTEKLKVRPTRKCNLILLEYPQYKKYFICLYLRNKDMLIILVETFQDNYKLFLKYSHYFHLNIKNFQL